MFDKTGAESLSVTMSQPTGPQTFLLRLRACDRASTGMPQDCNHVRFGAGFEFVAKHCRATRQLAGARGMYFLRRGRVLRSGPNQTVAANKPYDEARVLAGSSRNGFRIW